jgi:hypothetical protein
MLALPILLSKSRHSDKKGYYLPIVPNIQDKLNTIALYHRIEFGSAEKLAVGKIGRV